MAMIDNAQKVPFGAITTYRITSALTGVADNLTAWNARRKMAAEFELMTPRELEDIGLSAVAKNAKPAGIFTGFTGWVNGKIEARRTAAQLSGLSPALLSDIGLTQADVNQYRDRASFL